MPEDPSNKNLGPLIQKRSREASIETANLIENSVKKIHHGQKIAFETAKMLKKIVESVIQVTNLAREIADASNQQARGVNEINLGLKQLNNVTQENVSISRQGTSASRKLSKQVDQLKQMVSKFQLKSQQTPSSKTFNQFTQPSILD